MNIIIHHQAPQRYSHSPGFLWMTVIKNSAEENILADSIKRKLDGWRLKLAIIYVFWGRELQLFHGTKKHWHDGVLSA